MALTGAAFDRLVANEVDKLRWIKEAVGQLKIYRGEKSNERQDKPATEPSRDDPR